MVQIDETESVTFNDTSKLVGDISTLYLDQRFSDVTLLVDGERLRAHKAILAARSDHFESCFSEDPQIVEISITDFSKEAVTALLKYIYTGIVSIDSNIPLTLSVLTLAHKCFVQDLVIGLINRLKSIINITNVFMILNTSTLYDFDDLQIACLSFMESRVPEILSNDMLNGLSQKSMIKLLNQDTFVAPEIEIFKSVQTWREKNNDVDDAVMKSVRLSSLSVEEILITVWPSKCLDSDDLLQAIAEIVDVKPKTTQPRALKMVDDNLATIERQAQVISGNQTSDLLTCNRDVWKYAVVVIDGKNGFIIKLGTPAYVNHITMRLWDYDTRFYKYYIEVSLDQKKWKKVIDFSTHACRSVQNLYFQEQVIQYIKIVGTHNSVDNAFHLVYLEAYLKSNVPNFVDGIIYPNSNVATYENKAIVSEGTYSEYLLNGDKIFYDQHRGYTFHVIGKGSIIVQLAQPYMISSVRLLLWDKDDRGYKYFMETSTDKLEWEIVADRRHKLCRSWQTLRFNERAVVFFRITGTYCTVNDVFQCVHFECPVQENIPVQGNIPVRQNSPVEEAR